MKAKIKMISLETFKTISIDRCTILLNEVEAYYIYSKFIDKVYNTKVSKENLQKSMFNIVKDFQLTTENKYFSNKDVSEVSKFFTERIIYSLAFLNEEIGRGRESGFDQITHNKVLSYNNDIYIEKGADTFGEKDIMYLEDEEGNKKTLTVDDTDHASVVLSQIKVKAITKNNL